MVTNETRQKYLTCEDGTSITQSDILGYFVWIPRYKYKITTGGSPTPSSIDIVFENFTTTKSIGDAKTEYFTHPGFNFDNRELNGMWAVKFEISGTIENPTIKPNTNSLINYNLVDQFNASKKFNNYGVDVDARITKNT